MFIMILTITIVLQYTWVLITINHWSYESWFINGFRIGNLCSVKINKYEVGCFGSYNWKSLSNDYSNNIITIQ